MKNKIYIHSLVLGAMLTALAIVLNYLIGNDFIVPGVPIPTLRVSPGAPFFKLAGILLGPFFGALSATLVDIIGVLTKPKIGGFNPMYTVIMAMGGFLVGILWKVVKNIKIKHFAITYLSIFSVIGIWGIINSFMFKYYATANYSIAIEKFFVNQAMASYALIFTFIGALVFCFLIYLISKRFETSFETYFKLLIAVGGSTLFITTANTYPLMLTLTNGSGFFALWLPRFIKSLIVIPVESYIIFVLIGALKTTNLSKMFHVKHL